MNKRKNEYVCTFMHHFQEIGENGAEQLRKTAADLASLYSGDRKGKILKFALAKEIKQSELDIFLSTLDIETLQGGDALLLAYAKLRHPDNYFGEVNEPRLKGLIQYYRFQNLHQAACFSEAVSVLNDEQNQYFASYDTAMKWYIPQYFRMNDTMGIVAVSATSEKSILNQLKAGGYTITRNYGFFSASKESADGTKQFKVFDRLNYLRSSRQFANRLGNQPVFNNECLIPAVEDMLCSCYARIWQKLTSDFTFQGLGLDIWDLICLLESSSFSGETIGTILAETKMSAQVFFIHTFLQSFTGELLPDCSWIPKEDDEVLSLFISEETSRIHAKYDSNGNRKQTIMKLTENLMPGVAQKIRSIRRRMQM